MADAKLQANYGLYTVKREASGLTNADVARLTGMSEAMLSYWKSGKRTPKLDSLSKIAEAIGCEVSELISYGSGEPIKAVKGPRALEDQDDRYRLTKANYDKYVKLRDSKGYSDADVARLAGISPVTMTHWKQGRSRPREDKLKKIAEALQCGTDLLVGDLIIERKPKAEDRLIHRIMSYMRFLDYDEKKLLADTAEIMSKHSTVRHKDLDRYAAYSIGYEEDMPELRAVPAWGLESDPVVSSVKPTGIHLDSLTKEQRDMIVALADQIRAQEGKE